MIENYLFFITKEGQEMNLGYFKTANQLKKEGKLEESIEFYFKAIEQNKSFYWSYHNLADTLVKLERLDEAVIACHRTLELNPNSPWSHHNLGEALAKLGQLDAAILAYRRAIELNPNFYGFYNKLGQALYQLSIEFQSESWEPHNRLGEVLPKLSLSHNLTTDLVHLNDEAFLEATNQLNDQAFVEEVYRIYLKRDADEGGENNCLHDIRNGMTRPQLIASFRQSQEFRHKFIISIRSTELHELSDDVFLQVTDQLSDTEFLEEVYHTYLKRDADEAGKNYHLQNLSNGISRQEMVSGLKTSPEFKSKLGISVSSACLQEAVIAYRRVIELNPNSHNCYKSFGKVLTEWGKVLAQRGEVELAIESYQEAIAVCHNFAEAHYNQGNEFLHLGRKDEAIDSYKKAISIKSDWISPYLSLGEILKLDQPEEAIKWWQKAIPYIHSEDVRTDLECQICNLLVKQGQLDEAITKWEKIIPYIQSEATRIDTEFKMATLLVEHHRLDEALVCIERAMGLTNFCQPTRIQTN